MNIRAVRPQPRLHEWRRLLFDWATPVVLAAGLLWGAAGFAAEHQGKADDASAHQPAEFQSKVLDEKALSSIRGKGGSTNLLQPSINLGIILWDEPGSGGTKQRALAENQPGGAVRPVLLNRSDQVSVIAK